MVYVKQQHMDLTPYIERETECIAKLSSIDMQDYLTKKDYVQKLIETERILITEGYYPNVTIDKLATFIRTKLLENNIAYPKNERFYDLFDEEEKRGGGYGTTSESLMGDSHNHDFKLQGDNLSECECGAIIYKNLLYDIAIEKIDDSLTPQLDHTAIERSDPTKHPTSHYLWLMQVNAMIVAKVARDMWTKYFDKKHPKRRSEKADLIDKAIRNVEHKIDEMKNLQAKIIYVSKLADARQKIGPFEKLKAAILVDTTYNLSHVAKMLQITDKHATNTIKKKKIELTHDLAWFKDIHLDCHVPECGNTNTYAIGDWYYEQTIRKSLGLTLTQPFS